jgi:hypothetical protein
MRVVSAIVTVVAVALVATTAVAQPRTVSGYVTHTRDGATGEKHADLD